eukprot:scaffold16349_cov146-Skeletonema_menzelii.AAC.4
MELTRSSSVQRLASLRGWMSTLAWCWSSEKAWLGVIDMLEMAQAVIRLQHRVECLMSSDREEIILCSFMYVKPALPLRQRNLSLSTSTKKIWLIVTVTDKVTDNFLASRTKLVRDARKTFTREEHGHNQSRTKSRTTFSRHGQSLVRDARKTFK